MSFIIIEKTNFIKNRNILNRWENFYGKICMLCEENWEPNQRDDKIKKKKKIMISLKKKILNPSSRSFFSYVVKFFKTNYFLIFNKIH